MVKTYGRWSGSDDVLVKEFDSMEQACIMMGEILPNFHTKEVEYPNIKIEHYETGIEIYSKFSDGLTYIISVINL